MSALVKRTFVFGVSAALTLLVGCGGGASNAGAGTSGPTGGGQSSSNPVPILTSVSPASASAGSPGLSVTLTGSNFIPTSTAEWNGAPLQTSYTSAASLTAQIPASDLGLPGTNAITVANPSPGGGVSAAMSFVISPPPTQGTTAVNIQANDLAWDPVNQVIYLSLPSVDGSNGNTVQILDPGTGRLGASAFAGSEPNLLSVSSTSKYLYVSLNGASNVQRMVLPGLQPDVVIALGADQIDGPFYAMDLQADPASDQTVAVVRGTPQFSPQEEGGVLIYDNATARPNVLCGWIESGCRNTNTGLYDSIQWSKDGTEMFAANNETTSFDFYTVPVTSTGFGTPIDYGNLVPGFGSDIHYDATTGDVYDDDGEVIDPLSGAVIGTFAASGLMVPDGSVGKAFFIGQTTAQFGSQNFTIESFDISKFTPIASLTLTNVAGVPTHLIRWGTNGLAFTTTSGGNSTVSGKVYLVSGSIVDGSALAKERPAENVRRTWKAQLPVGQRTAAK